MISKLQLQTVVYVAFFVFGALLLLNGVKLSRSWIGYVSVAAGISAFLATPFDLWLWRLQILRGWFVKRPDIKGTWRAAIRSDWEDGTTGHHTPMIEGYVAIRQTYSLLSIRLMTAESRSESIGTELIRSTDGTFRVLWVYRNDPGFLIRHRSAIHYGAAILAISEPRPETLSGHYWTDRHSGGELRLTARSRALFDDFPACQTHFLPAPVAEADAGQSSERPKPS